jgi:predicted nucleotidyltransferase
METILREAKQVIYEEVERAGFEVRRVLLFGSRARGEARPDSDWDFYVIIAPSASEKVRWEIADRICERLAEAPIWADVFVQSEEAALQRAGDTGYLTYYVLKEGIEL